MAHAQHARHIAHGSVTTCSVTPNQRPQRPRHRSNNTNGNECVHRGCTMSQVHDGSAMEWPCSPSNYWGRKNKCPPLPVLKLHRLEHGKEEHWRSEQRANNEPVAQSQQVLSKLFLGCPYWRIGLTKCCLIACFFHGVNESVGLYSKTSAHCCRFSCVVH